MCAPYQKMRNKLVIGNSYQLAPSTMKKSHFNDEIQLKYCQHSHNQEKSFIYGKEENFCTYHYGWLGR